MLIASLLFTFMCLIMKRALETGCTTFASALTASFSLKSIGSARLCSLLTVCDSWGERMENSRWGYIIDALTLHCSFH